MGKTKTKTPRWLEILRIQMNALGMNPRSLSLQAGLNPTAVRDMLEGRIKFPRYDTVQALAGALSLRPAQLMGDEIANENDTEDDDLDLLIEIITRLQEEATLAKCDLPPSDFAAMTAAIYRQMKVDPVPKKSGSIQPKVLDLLAYETLKKRAGSK